MIKFGKTLNRVQKRKDGVISKNGKVQKVKRKRQ